MSNFLSTDCPTFHKHHDQECDDPECPDHRRSSTARERLEKEIEAAKIVKEKIKRGRTFDPNSQQAIQGASGEERAFRLITEHLSHTSLYIRRGSENPRVNGMMGDITLSPSVVDAPLVGVEVKTSGGKYPDSFSISRFELESSLAEWVLVMNEVEAVGVWIITMEEARRCARDMGEYFVCKPPLRSHVPFSQFIYRLESAGGGRDQR